MRRLPRILLDVTTVVSLVLLLCGTNACHSCRDISESDPVRASGAIGRKVTLAAAHRVVERPHLHRLMLVPASEELAADDVARGSLPAGTTVSIVRVERCTYPPGITTDFTVATVDDGPMAGTRVTANRAGLAPAMLRIQP